MSTRKAVVPLVLFAGLLLIVLSGCSLWTATSPIEVVASVTQGRPNVADGGLLVRFRCSGGTGKFDFDPGDGGEALSSDTGSFTHTYALAGTYEAVVSSGGRSQTITIEVINRAPQVYVPFTANTATCDWMGRKVYDAQYQEHGCEVGTGASLWAYGAYDPDGDALSYKWSVTGPDKNGTIVEYSVFDTHDLAEGEVRRNISGTFTNDRLVVFFAGWTQEAPPYGFYVNPLCEIDPWEPPEPAPDAGVITLTFTARDTWGGETTISWTIQLSSTGCSSS